MKARKELANKIINSLNTEAIEWEFDNYVATNKIWGIVIWITNIPIIDIHIWKPTIVKFNLYEKYKIHQAITEAKAKKIIALNQRPTK